HALQPRRAPRAPRRSHARDGRAECRRALARLGAPRLRAAAGAAVSPFVRAFEAMAREHAHRVAVAGDDATWSFADLDEVTARLARRLCDEGVRPGGVVALSLGRSAWHVAAILAAWRAGAAFVPLDPAAPEERVRGILAETRARVVIGPAGGDVRVAR